MLLLRPFFKQVHPGWTIPAVFRQPAPMSRTRIACFFFKTASIVNELDHMWSLTASCLHQPWSCRRCDGGNLNKYDGFNPTLISRALISTIFAAAGKNIWRQAQQKKLLWSNSPDTSYPARSFPPHAGPAPRSAPYLEASFRTIPRQLPPAPQKTLPAALSCRQGNNLHHPTH